MNTVGGRYCDARSRCRQARHGSGERQGGDEASTSLADAHASDPKKEKAAQDVLVSKTGLGEFLRRLGTTDRLESLPLKE